MIGAFPVPIPPIVGEIRDYAGATAPSGWLFPFGQDVSRTTYAALFGKIGTAFGAGNGSTTFNLPDLRGRVAAGKDDMGGTPASRLNVISGLGATGGDEEAGLSTSQLPTHGHGIPTGMVANVNSAGDIQIGGGTVVVTSVDLTTSNTDNAGDGDAHPNVQPTIILNKIIYTGV